MSYVGDSHRLRVLIVTAMYPTAKRPHWGTFVKSQVDSLAAVGVDATVLHISGSAKLKYVVAMRRVRHLAASQQFDLVHGHYGFCGIVARAQARLPVVVSFCGGDLLGTPNRSGGKTLVSQLEIRSSRLLASMVDAIIVKSAEMRRVLGNGLKTPVTVIPNGVDFDLFRPIPQREARQRLGLDPQRRYVVFPANPDLPRKGYAVLQAAARQLQDTDASVDLLPISGRPQSEVVLALSAADVMALPSLWEGSPNVIKEAMACNIPIVSADVGDVREVIGATPGCYVVATTPSDFAAAIREVLRQPGVRTTGREQVAHLSLANVAVRVRKVYDEAIARPNRHPSFSQPENREKALFRLAATDQSPRD